MGFQVNRATHRLCFGLKEIARWDLKLSNHTQSLALVKWNRQMGFQVNRATHRLYFGLKEIARWDLRLTPSKGQVARENRPA
jgi:hypothetical protein